MALLFMDSFDHYATADVALGKWTSLTQVSGSGDTSQIVTTGRRSSNAWRMSLTGGVFNAAKTLIYTPAAVGDATLVVGFAFNPVTPTFASLPVSTTINDNGVSQAPMLLNIRRASTDQCWLRINTDGTVTLYRGTTALGTTSAPLVQATYTYVEVQLVIATGTGGSCTIRFNGTSVLTAASLNTAGSGTGGWTEVRLGYPGLPSGTLDWQFDDFYLLDGTGSAPWNACLGDCRVDPRYVTAAGATTGWTASTGANYTCVDETAPNGDTDYVSAASSPLTDTYTCQDAPVVGATLYGVQLCVFEKKTDAGTCAVAPVVRHSGVDYAGTAVNLSTSYAYSLSVYATNPGTSAAWTEAHFNAAEFGVKRTA